MRGVNSIRKGLKILVVDDHAPMRKLVRSLLLDLGFQNISEAAGAVDAVTMLKSGQSFDLIISDWNMPTMTGLELLAFMRSDDRTKEIPFLMITAEGERENIIKAAKAGISQYILKPFTVEALQQKLEKIFSQP